MQKSDLLRRALTLASTAFVATASTGAFAGGYLAVVNNQPAAWTNASVTVNLDQGELGALTNDQANAFVLTALQGWQNSAISTSALNIQTGPQIPFDVAGDNALNIFNNLNDPFNPVIYDDNGSVTAAITGPGNQDFVIGLALPGGIDAEGNIFDGSIVMNGLFIDGNENDISVSEFQGAIRHEFGHFLNLDHAQFNDSFANAGNFTNYPTMYPSVHPDVLSLAPDDVAWISDIYPTSALDNFTTFTGTIRNRFPNAAPITGVNVVARLISDPTFAISCVSGFNDIPGAYRIPRALPGQQYVVDIEPIRLGSAGGSSVGPLEVPLDLFLNGVAEYLNDEAFESTGDQVFVTTTFLSGSAGESVALPDLRLNTPPPPFNRDEIDNGGNFPEDAQVLFPIPGSLTRVTGTITAEEVGSFELDLGNNFTDDYEDIYAVSLKKGVELQRVTLIPNTDQDLIIVDSNGVVLASSRLGGTSTEIIDSFHSTDLSDGGLIYILISNFTGELPGRYTLEIRTAVSDSDFVAVTSVTGQVPGTITINGTGFSDFLDQIIQFSDPNLVVDSVNFISENQVEANVSLTGGFDNPVTIQVSNDIFAGGFGGRLTTQIQQADLFDAWLFY